MTQEHPSSKSGDKNKTEELEKRIENLKKIIELQNKTVDHDRKLQRNFRYEMM